MISTACSRDRELFASKVSNPTADKFPIASKDSNRNVFDELVFEVLPIAVGDEDREGGALDKILGIVLIVEGDGAIVAPNSSDNGASDGWDSNEAEVGLNDAPGGENESDTLGDHVELALGARSIFLQRGDCGCMH